MTDPTPDDDEPRPEPRGNLVAIGYGLAALALACIPPALFATAADEGRAGDMTFDGARGWVGLARFCVSSLILVGPVLWLVRLAGREARHWAATLPATLALILALPMIPGTVIQLAWWITQ